MVTAVVEVHTTNGPADSGPPGLGGPEVVFI